MSTRQIFFRLWSNPKITAEGQKRFKLILKYHKIKENKLYYKIKVISPYKQTLNFFSDLTITPKLPKKVKMTPKVQKKTKMSQKRKKIIIAFKITNLYE